MTRGAAVQKAAESGGRQYKKGGFKGCLMRHRGQSRHIPGGRLISRARRTGHIIFASVRGGGITRESEVFSLSLNRAPRDLPPRIARASPHTQGGSTRYIAVLSPRG